LDGETAKKVMTTFALAYVSYLLYGINGVVLCTEMHFQ